MYEENFVGRISCLYNESGLSVNDFAKKVGISRQTMDFYLNGKRSPSAESISKICKSCNVTADWMLALSDVRSPSKEIQNIVNTLHLSEAAAKNMIRMKDEDCDYCEPFSYLLEHMDFFTMLRNYKRFYNLLHQFYKDKEYKNTTFYKPIDQEREIEDKDNATVKIDLLEAIHLFRYETICAIEGMCIEEEVYFVEEENDSLDYIETARKIKEDIYSSY